MTSERTLFDFAQRDLTSLWSNMDDPVMGGVSRSRMASVAGQDVARFAGTVSLQNNGGFASVRSAALRPADDLSAYTAIRARVKGDGKTYIFSVQTYSAPRLNYWQRFRTLKDKWAEVTLTLDKFMPVFRGYTPPGSPALDARAIANYGIYIADKQTGPFMLDVAWIKAINL